MDQSRELALSWRADLLSWRRGVGCMGAWLELHCKDKTPKVLKKYFQKRNIGVSVQISTFMRLWVIYIFPRSVCLFCWRKYVDRSWYYINGSQTHECGAEAALFPGKEYISGIFVAVCDAWSLPPAGQTVPFALVRSSSVTSFWQFQMLLMLLYCCYYNVYFVECQHWIRLFPVESLR